ncbi:hypothetical protein [Companilactobacillus mishanensis]|uniref:hypothetical protein n=1 Tax=Companilactobacillus mishanensis TaxID=2486008 RepID=UPI001295627B|nr:hypothetical protein [Companilactobacillus mishanensis]
MMKKYMLEIFVGHGGECIVYFHDVSSVVIEDASLSINQIVNDLDQFYRLVFGKEQIIILGNNGSKIIINSNSYYSVGAIVEEDATRSVIYRNRKKEQQESNSLIFQTYQD